MPRVFIIQEPAGNWSPDLSTAVDHGAIHYIFPAKTNLAADPDRWLKHAEHRLADFDPTADSILDLACGHVDPMGPVMIATILAMDPDVKVLRWLRWDRKRDAAGHRCGGFYVPVTLKLED